MSRRGQRIASTNSFTSDKAAVSLVCVVCEGCGDHYRLMCAVAAEGIPSLPTSSLLLEKKKTFFFLSKQTTILEELGSPP